MPRASGLLDADELQVEHEGLARADRRTRVVAEGLLGRQVDFPARTDRHERQHFADADERELVDLAGGRLRVRRRVGIGQLLTSVQRVAEVHLHFAGRGRTRAGAGVDDRGPGVDPCPGVAAGEG